MGLSGEEAVQEWVVFTFIYSLLYYIYQKSILIAIREPFQEYFLDISACFRFACACHYYSYLRFWRGYQIAIPFFALECSINSYLSEGGLDDPIDNIPIIMNGDFQGFFRIVFQVVGCALASWFSQLLWKMKYGKAFVTTDPTFLATIYNSNNNVGAFMCNSQTALSFALNSFSLEFFGTILRVVLADLRHRHIKLRNKLFVAFFNFAIILQGAGNKGYVLNPLYLVTSTFFCPHFSLLNSLRFYTASLLGSICASTLLIQARKWYNKIPSRLVSATCGSLSSSTSSLSPINSNILFPNNVTNGLSKVSMALTKHFSKSMN